VTHLSVSATEFRADMLDGLVDAYSRYLDRVPGASGVMRTGGPRRGKVAVVIGGGSGHYPAFAGLVGAGLADAAVIGDVFTSPSAEQAYLVGRAVDGGAGILFSYGNYAGDADVQFRRYMHSKGGFNKSHMNNPEFDAILDKASGTYDVSTRVGLYHDAQMMDFNSLAYYGYLWTQWYNWALNKRVVNFPQVMGGAWDLRGVWLGA